MLETDYNYNKYNHSNCTYHMEDSRILSNVFHTQFDQAQRAGEMMCRVRYKRFPIEHMGYQTRELERVEFRKFLGHLIDNKYSFSYSDVYDDLGIHQYIDLRIVMEPWFHPECSYDDCKVCKRK